MKKLNLTPAVFLGVTALAAAIPAVFGVTPLAMLASLFIVALAALFTESGTSSYTGTFRRQFGKVGSLEDVAEQYKEVQANLKDVQSNLEKHFGHSGEISARLQAIEQAVAKHGYGEGTAALINSVGAEALDSLRESSAFAALSEWNQGTARAPVHAGIRAIINTPSEGTSSEGHYMPSNPERSGVFGPALRPLRLLEALESRPTTADSVEHVRLHYDGEPSEQLEEGDEKKEIDIEGELVRANIVTIAGHTTASRQVLSDHAALQANINEVMNNKLMARLEHRLINGQGGQGKIEGFIEVGTTFLPTIGATPADIIGEALVRQADKGYSPSIVVMNPLDWFRLQLTRKGDTDNEYLFGSPTMPVPPSLWNVAVVRTPAMPEGEALTIDGSHVTVLDREQASVMLSNSHKDYFTRNLVAILGELRAGLEVRDAWAVYHMDLSAPSSE
ncbi:phage major capsid protein [Pseudazoarcus pumilus]|uniref:Phage major capsid protein n=1 Tax=Pseudazoarcus pumilus TaxID=2067960 RepID=A0A2I6S6D2_9RHOO|nr:phage major capsid protein [Pseudazoarcus pumilus]AUN94813.1 phage major capsid protein [Pseudazoarcus pumilus]